MDDVSLGDVLVGDATTGDAMVGDAVAGKALRRTARVMSALAMGVPRVGRGQGSPRHTVPHAEPGVPFPGTPLPGTASPERGAAAAPASLLQQKPALALAALVRDSVAAGAKRHVLHLRQAQLVPLLQKPDQRRALRQAVGRLGLHARTMVYHLPNGDVVVAAPPPAITLHALHDMLHGMLSNNVSSARGDAPSRLGKPEAPQSLHQLPEEATLLLALVEDVLGMAGQRHGQNAPAVVAQSFSPTALAQLEPLLARAELARFLRGRSICMLPASGGVPSLRWEERSCLLEELCAELAPEQPWDLAAAPALKRRLQARLDARVLAEFLTLANRRSRRPQAIALRLETLLGPAFQRFDAAAPREVRERLRIGFDAADILRDPTTAHRMQQRLSARGYITMLQPVESPVLQWLDLGRFDFRHIGLRWNAALVATAAPPAGVEASRLVLVDVDCTAAVGWGWERGITHFAGPLVEMRRAFR